MNMQNISEFIREINSKWYLNEWWFFASLEHQWLWDWSKPIIENFDIRK